MHGIPWWGETTWRDMRAMDETPAFEDIPEDLRKCKDIYEVFYEMAKQGYVLKLGKYYTWCSDIRFDYRDKAIFAPYYIYLESDAISKVRHKHLDVIDDERGLIKLRHDFELRLKPIYLADCGYKNFELEIFKPADMRLYRINLSDMPLFEQELSIVRLYNAYLDASYYDEAWEDIDYENIYHWIGNAKGKNVEYTLRQSRGLKTFALGRSNSYATSHVQRIYNYRDIRVYDLQTINSLFCFNLNTTMWRWERRYRFDAYLLLGMLSGKQFIEKDFNEKFKLLGFKENFLVYNGDNTDFPLYLKHYYRPEDKMTRKSYEKYLTFRSVRDFMEE